MRHDTNTLTEILVARVSREGEILVSNPKNVSPKIIFVHDLYCTVWVGRVGYKWWTKMIFVRPTRNKWAGGVVLPSEI